MFLVCGEALWDLFAANDADRLTLDARVGGSPFNVALGLARLNQKSALLTGMSRDPMGRRLKAALDREQVATDYVVETDRPSTLSLVDFDSSGQPAYAFYGHETADKSVRLEDLPMLGPNVWGLHAGSYSLVAEPVGSSLLSLFEREAGRRLITLDPNVRLTVEPDAAIWRDRVDRFATHADLIKVSDEDLGQIFPGTVASEIAARWLDAGAALVVVTRGDSGAEAFLPGDILSVAGHRIDVIDSVGAGDTFQAALIAGLSELGIWSRQALQAASKSTLSNLIDFAARAAAITCGRRGADLPHRDALPALTAGGSD
ncbi:MAG: carbohydrate kinase [Pseudomonadota bacterium]